MIVDGVPVYTATSRDGGSAYYSFEPFAPGDPALSHETASYATTGDLEGCKPAGLDRRPASGDLGQARFWREFPESAQASAAKRLYHTIRSDKRLADLRAGAGLSHFLESLFAAIEDGIQEIPAGQMRASEARIHPPERAVEPPELASTRSRDGPVN